MFFLRRTLVFVLCISLCLYSIPASAGSKPMGILTQATAAHLNAAEAFAGLSIFEGETLSTDTDGRLGVRLGRNQVVLGGDTNLTIQPIDNGEHIDLAAGSLYFSAVQDSLVEVHVEEAMLRPEGTGATQAEITILSPRVIQVSPKHGALAFSYRQEFQLLPEGETYRIHLDAPGEPQGPQGAGADTEKAGKSRSTKVAYFIVGAVAAGLTLWGIRDWIESSSGSESPAKP
jgi:hypothetical protein